MAETILVQKECLYCFFKEIKRSSLNTVHFFFLQNDQLHQENAELRHKLQSAQEQAEVAQQAIRDRDEAIAKWEAHLFFIIFNSNYKNHMALTGFVVSGLLYKKSWVLFCISAQILGWIFRSKSTSHCQLTVCEIDYAYCCNHSNEFWTFLVWYMCDSDSSL